MKNRLTEVDRIKLEARYNTLREVVAALEPGKVSGLADKIGPDQAEISGFVEALMKLMDAEPEVSKYKKANKQKIYSLLKKAFDMAPNPDAGENPEEEAMHLKDPAMHMVEDLEHEVQTLDDATLTQLVEKLEERMKSDLAKMPGASPMAATSNAPMVPPPAPAPEHSAPAPAAEHSAPAAPKPPAPEKSESSEEPSEDKKPFPPKKESSESEDSSDEEDSSDDEKEEKPEMKSEARLALLMSLPEEQRLAKAAQLRALAGVLESDAREVSQDNEINEVNSNPALQKDYEDQEDGSMKDVKAAQLKQTARQLLAALEDSTEEDKKDEKDEMDKEAVLSLALRHLIASVEDMEEAKKDDEDDSEEKMEKEASEDSKPEWLEDAEKKAEEKEDKEPSKEEKTAILKAKLANLKRTTRTATVDGKTMKTPKEVPSPSGTTEDNLKGDAKIQYSTNNGEDGLDVINDKRTPTKSDKSVAGTDEPNELYFSNNPAKDRYAPTSESDSSKDVNNKRVLKDMGEAVQKSSPTSPTDHMEMGSGSHQKEKTWDKAKSESDTTPSGDRLVGLAEMIEHRTERAIKLAGKMAELGLISTGSQLTEKIIELAKMEDKEFTVVSSFLSNNLSKVAPSKSRTAGEMPPWLDKGKEKDESDDEEDSDEEDNMPKKEAGAVRRVARKEDTDEEVSSIRRATRRAERGGLKTALLSGTDDLLNESSSVRGNNSYISKALSKIAWTDPKTIAQEKSDLNELFKGEGR